MRKINKFLDGSDQLSPPFGHLQIPHLLQKQIQREKDGLWIVMQIIIVFYLQQHPGRPPQRLHRRILFSGDCQPSDRQAGGALRMHRSSASHNGVEAIVAGNSARTGPCLLPTTHLNVSFRFFSHGHGLYGEKTHCNCQNDAV